MSRHSRNLHDSPLRGMYRDRENGWVFGVCAGLADFANFRTSTVRLVAIICLVLFFWPTVLLYVAATVLFREKPLIYSGRRAEYEFWRRRSGDDRWSRL
jgi:phage shock protein C